MFLTHGGWWSYMQVAEDYLESIMQVAGRWVKAPINRPCTMDKGPFAASFLASLEAQCVSRLPFPP
jgi:hypothetical protein